MSKVLIIAEHDGQSLNSSTAKCVTCAAAIEGSEIDIVVLAADSANIAAEAAQISGVSRVITVNNPANAHSLAATIAPQVVAIAAKYSHVFGPSTTF
ncbi:MAG: electron transfer flavoprotein subunit alpha/FixB family protein, partial [Woeseia sp.]